MTDFQLQITNWFRHNKRDLPWRISPSPYKSWLSEIILQQTRVAQGLPYFNKFIHNYPDVESFANATEDDLLLLWQGLGYYSRVRNMHTAAKQVITEFNAVFPNKFQDLKKLKGVGDYTAAAIASICAEENVAVVDGNVYRVLSRFFNIDTPIDSAAGKKEFQNLAQELIKDCDQNGNYNQGLMEIGALICSPKTPNCDNCPINERCIAYSKSNFNLFPVKSKKIKVTNRYLNFLVIQDKNNYLIQQRIEKDIWQNLYQFPLIEYKNDSIDENYILKLFDELEGVTIEITQGETLKHKLSHQNITADFWEVKLDKINIDLWPNSIKIKKSEIIDFGIPKLIDNYLLSKNKK
ncbi:MAG: A/G-specific adenine glycosylase [Flavobacteriales bacterium]|jgi:A/G-specific adenine glycosylase